ncbi:methyltransferase, FxLD system [Streptomyces violaceusniger]
MTTSPTTDLDEATAPRHQLAGQLAAAGHIRTPAVHRALRTVPRHAFAPEVPVHKAYANDIVATRHSDEGRITSSVSAPWLQADMLEAARVQPGHRVLEIGSGGCNAALIAELVGPTGHVTTLDIDPAVTDRATRFLAQTGYDHVHVVTADAEHLPTGIVPADGLDAILVTVDTWDLPRIDALAEGGRLVAPLRLHGYAWAIGFSKRDGALHSDEPLIVCGFVSMQGEGARNATRRTVPGTGIHLSWEDGAPLSVDQLAPSPTREPTVTQTHVTVGGQEPFDALTLYPAGALPGFCRLSVDPDGENGVLNPPPKHWPGAAIVRGTSLARLATKRIGDGDDGNGRYEFVVHGYGPHGHLAAQEMAEQVLHWQRNHRAALCPRITVHPLADGDPASTADGAHVFVKKHTRVAIDWPIIPGTAALHAHHNADQLGGRHDAALPLVEVREPRDHRSRSIVGAHLVLIRDGAVLLGKRHPNSAFAPSTWHLPAGHREDMEAAVTCMVREAEEETGLRIPEGDLSLVHVLDLLDPGSTIPRIGLFFAPSRWEGEPLVREPECCTEWRFWPLDDLPEPTVEYTRVALDAISRGSLYAPMGWS